MMKSRFHRPRAILAVLLVAAMLLSLCACNPGSAPVSQMGSTTAGQTTTAGTNGDGTTAGTNGTTAGTNGTTAGTNGTTAGTNGTTAGTTTTQTPSVPTLVAGKETVTYDSMIDLLPEEAADAWECNGNIPASASGSRQQGWLLRNLNGWGANLAKIDAWSYSENWMLYYDFEVDAESVGIYLQWWNVNVTRAIAEKHDITPVGENGDHAPYGRYTGVIDLKDLVGNLDTSNSADVKWLLNVYLVKGQVEISALKLVHVTSYKTDSTPSVTPPVTEQGFFDDFTNGIDPTRWNIVSQVWGGGNNGVIPENVNYTSDGVLVFTANGDLYDGDINNGKGKRTGACITTADILGPGSFEVRMKVLPRLGTCTAMWTYFNDGRRNHEIDIELPGNTSTFKFNLFTNWITESTYSSNRTYPDFYHNDGEWHTYRFDWHTEPQRIDYYIDGKLEFSISRNIPTVATYFWVGVWFPQNWCGDPAFETAHMLVDWVKYTPYDEAHEKSRQSFNNKSNKYPTAPIALPTNNYVANGDLEKAAPGWTSSGSISFVNSTNGSKMLALNSSSATYTQVVSSINADSVYQLTGSALASSAGAQAKIKFEYLAQNKSTVLGSTELTYTTQQLTKKTQTVTTPSGTYFIRITLTGSGSGTFAFDDLYITQPNRGDFS